jgi:hypothetical protein
VTDRPEIIEETTPFYTSEEPESYDVTQEQEKLLDEWIEEELTTL